MQPANLRRLRFLLNNAKLRSSLSQLSFRVAQICSSAETAELQYHTARVLDYSSFNQLAIPSLDGLKRHARLLSRATG